MSQDSPTPLPIRFLRSLRLLLHLVWVAVGTLTLYPLLDDHRRASLKQRWSRQILGILSVRLETQPNKVPPGSLIVANHISWLDIFAIYALRPVAFISKAEISQWPFIGWLAKKNDTVFLRRGSHGHARIVNAEIDTLLNAGIDVAIFPEGTTTDGTHLLSFHAALLQPAIETGRPVLPLAISYHDAAGNVSRTPAFVGNTTLVQSLASILGMRSLTVRLIPTAVIDSTQYQRRELARLAHAAIASQRGFRSSHSSPEKLSDPQAG